MIKTPRKLLTAAVLSAVLVLAAGTASAQAPCVPGFNAAFSAHAAQYTLVLNTLAPQTGSLRNLLNLVVDQPTYATLLTKANTLAASIANGRLLVSLPDGTVVLDTSRPDDPANALPEGNSYQHYQDKTVNENHNSRLAILTAQEYPCGVGIESKLSSSTGVREAYVAIRLGAHLDNAGTARLSTR